METEKIDKYEYSENVNRHVYTSKFDLTPVNKVIASSALLPSFGYDSRHRCHTPRTLNFGMNSTCIYKISNISNMISA